MKRQIHIGEDNWVRFRRPVLGLILLALLGLGWAAGAWVTERRNSHNVKVASIITTAAGDQVSFTSGFTPVVEKVLPAVVSVSSAKIVRFADSGPTFPFFFDPSLHDFFGGNLSRGYSHPRQQREQSLGSGVVISSDGYLLTNNHVVEGSSEVRISLSDKREIKAKIVGTDPKTDIAVLKVEQRNLPVLPIADSTKVKPGQFALAVGNPFGLGETVTMGIVSATGRGNLNIVDYEDFIQTDAAVNPGNSGGALVDIHGALIGINTAILSRSGGNQGIGFAVPIGMARQVTARIVKDGKVVRGWLGVAIQPVTPAMARAMKLQRAEGALVGDVTPESPAKKAGIRRGDLVVAINGEHIDEARDLSWKVAMLSPGTTVRLNILREGREQEIPVVLGEQPSERQAIGQEPEDRAAPALEGVEVEDLTPQIKRELGLSARTTGVVVTDLEPGSSAAEAGLQPGDIIQEVNHHEVAAVSEFERAVRQASREPIMLLINRGGSTLFVVVEPE